jgi:hypothetical protein
LGEQAEQPVRVENTNGLHGAARRGRAVRSMHACQDVPERLARGVRLFMGGYTRPRSR